MSQTETPLKTLFRMRPELERDVLRFTTGEDVPYATALGWVLEAAEIAFAALTVDQARRVRASENEKQVTETYDAAEELSRLLRVSDAALAAKTAALALALEERDAARAKLLAKVLETAAPVETSSGPVLVIPPSVTNVQLQGARFFSGPSL